MSAGPKVPVAFVLGAGFSRAVAGAMPLMGDLGSAIIRRFVGDRRLLQLLSDADRRSIESGMVPLGNVEVWLTSLATDQPFLSASRNLQRQALFVELAAQIANEIEARRRDACAHPMPRWLIRLLTIWHHAQSAVITLNYDLLVECGVAALKLRSREGRFARPNDLMRGLPPEVPEMGRLGEEECETFSLLKLHGSTNWFGRPGNADLFSVIRVDALVPQWGAEVPDLRRAVRGMTQGLDRMILPPISDKSLLYGNPTLSALWRQAHHALAVAQELVVVGYSLPQTDGSTLALVAESLGPRAGITIVDVQAEQVSQRLQDSLGRNASTVTEPGSQGFDAELRRLELWTQSSINDEALEGVNPVCYVGVVLPNGEEWPIESIRTVGSQLELVTGEGAADPAGFTINPSAHPIDPRSLGARSALVRFPNGNTAVPLQVHVVRSDSESSSVTLDVSLPSA